MTKLKNTYSLQAFPTEKTLKEFKPVRGFHVHGTIELPPGQLPLLREMSWNRDADPLAWQRPILEVDLGPFYDTIAGRMGYDPALLREGRGETGQTDHGWYAYSGDRPLPLLIRWQAGPGQLLLSLGIHGQNSLSIAILADAAGLETLLKVYDLVTGIVAADGPTHRLSVQAGDTLQIVETATRPDWYPFGPGITVCLPPDRQLNDLRRKELEAIVGGVYLTIGTEAEVNGRESVFGTMPRLKPNMLRLQAIPPIRATLDFGPDEPLSQSLIELINETSVQETWKEFAQTMAEHEAAETDFTDWHELLEKEKLDVELSERRLKLRELVRGLCPPDYRRNAGRISLSADFETTPATHLRGTGPAAKMAEGCVATSGDLIDMLERAVFELSAPPLIYPSAETKPRLQLKGECHLPPLASQYADTGLEHKCFEELMKPYYSTHRGLPVRVDKRMLVWRAHDSEALVADYFRHPTTHEVHLAALYRAKVPVS